jgi:hypothetical protein
MKKLFALFVFVFAIGMVVNFSPCTTDIPEKETISWEVDHSLTPQGVKIVSVHYEPAFLHQSQSVEMSADQNLFMVYRALLANTYDSKDMLQTSISGNHQDANPTKAESHLNQSDKHFDPGSYGTEDKEA